jgi:hypothetical protein
MDEENAYELDKKFMTQQEVADLFMVSAGTIKNWRDAGLLEYFQVPGSTRVLYPIDAVNRFQLEHIKHSKVIPLRRPEAKEADRQELSSNRIKKQWRID